jgi:hypothetical protein
VKIINSDGFQLNKQERKGKVTETRLEFFAEKDGVLILHPGGQGLPEDFELRGNIRPENVFVGRGKVSPPKLSFSLAMRDRHALAWTDYNNDGVLDIYINRGALGGSLVALPKYISSRITDELLVSQGLFDYKDIAPDVGIEKRGCSGRHAKWVDFDQDGLLDLFVNCQNRGKIKGSFPKQLYQQNPDKRFTDVAAENGLDMLEPELISFAWFDSDSDGDIDLFASEDTGFYLYRNQGDGFSREFIGRGEFVRADDPKLRGTTNIAWFADGKLTLADFNTDGRIDIFSASKKGNMVLMNDGDGFSLINPGSLGLPPWSLTANWVDYDNDGLADLHAFPQGLFRQNEDRSFIKANLLTFPEDERYRAAICNWFDGDNDGRTDMVCALSENPEFKEWWQVNPPRKRRDHWLVKGYRNIGADNHWLQIRLAGDAGNPQGIGARVIVTTPGGRQTQVIGGNEGSFFSQGHYRLYFGLGAHQKILSITVDWPNMRTQELHDITADQLLTVRQLPVAEPQIGL